MACALARQKGQLNVTLLLRDPYVCKDINERHVNSRYLKVTTYSATKCLFRADPVTCNSSMALVISVLQRAVLSHAGVYTS